MVKFCAILSGANIVFMAIFWHRFSAPLADSTASFLSNPDSMGMFLAAQANHYSLLQIFLILISLAIAVVTYLGFNHIQRMAEEKAKETVENIAQNIVKEYLDEKGHELIQQSLFDNIMGSSSQRFNKDDLNNDKQTPFEEGT